MTGNFIDYVQILTDMRDQVTAAALGFKTVFKNADDEAFSFDNMPMLDLRLKRAVPDLIVIQQGYYTQIEVEAEIDAFHMTSRDKCATIRDNLTNALQRFFQENPRFSGSIESTVIGPVEFETAQTKAEGEFVAAAVATFYLKLYSDR